MSKLKHYYTLFYFLFEKQVLILLKAIGIQNILLCLCNFDILNLTFNYKTIKGKLYDKINKVSIYHFKLFFSDKVLFNRIYESLIIIQHNKKLHNDHYRLYSYLKNLFSRHPQLLPLSRIESYVHST